MENSFLFVYGSLRPQAGTPQGQWLAEQGHYLGSGVVSGQLYRVGWYPALGPGQDPVVGDIYGIPEFLWEKLDAYEEVLGENPEYRRILTPVQWQGGLCLDAWVYWYARPLAGLEPVSGGDWLNARP